MEVLRPKLILAGLIAVSLFLHVFRISYPDVPVNDEAHFATYAADYVRGRPFFDIHPPIGKLIYAAPLFIIRPALENTAKFFAYVPDAKVDTIKWLLVPSTYEGFPYLTLRLINVFFGTLLIIAVYSFLRILTGRESAALWGAFFIVFENAILLETRFILLNGMYLALGFFALALFLGRKTSPAVAGLVWGLALGVKLTAIVFLSALVAHVFLARGDERERELGRLKKFFAAGFLVLFFAIFFANNLFMPVRERLMLYENLFSWLPPVDENAPHPLPLVEPLMPYIKASLIELNNTLSGYVFDTATYWSQSSWYQWPFMKEPVRYFSDGNRGIYFVGNTVVWALSTFAAFFVAAMLALRFLKHKTRIFFGVVESKHRHTLVLLCGYVFSLIPFMLIQRPTFLTHYLPALTFGVLLAASVLSSYLDAQSHGKRRLLSLAVILSIISGFIISAPYTYGL